MVAAFVCGSCSGYDLSETPIGRALGILRTEPDHCYGHADRPAGPGVLGGYVCTCPCRDWLVGVDPLASGGTEGAGQDG